ncbi:unnamed protein product [Oikopleura dioica]|uniref:Uncharacterized protein n=1 Tax=Oikopleura dioica TaxID=34765 RepID=E4XME0_OIKDI|nr:unnamed protein product [Oikopleura dioica]
MAHTLCYFAVGYAFLIFMFWFFTDFLGLTQIYNEEKMIYEYVWLPKNI